MSEVPLSRENEQNFTGPIEAHEDVRGNTYLYRDDADTANAHYAAEAGAWEKAAQPGFEKSAQGIADDAQVEGAHVDAIWEDHDRTMQQEDDAAYEAERQQESDESQSQGVGIIVPRQRGSSG